MKDYAGSCHCGAIRLCYRTAVSPECWPLRACQCSFCRYHGVVVTPDPAGELSFRCEDPAHIRHDRFGHRTADFLLCVDCGVYVGAISPNNAQAIGVINTRVFMGLHLKYGSATHVRVDGETVQVQRERRRNVDAGALKAPKQLTGLHSQWGRAQPGCGVDLTVQPVQGEVWENALGGKPHSFISSKYLRSMTCDGASNAFVACAPCGVDGTVALVLAGNKFMLSPMDELSRYRWIAAHILAHESEVRGWLRRRLGSFGDNDIDDLVQEAYSRIWTADFATIRNGRAYLYTTVRHLLAEYARRSRIVPIELLGEIDSLNILSDEPGPDRLVGARQELERLRAIVGELPAQCRRVFELRKFDGLSHREIAQHMGLSEKTIENHLTRALARVAAGLAIANASQGDRHSDPTVGMVEDVDRGLD